MRRLIVTLVLAAFTSGWFTPFVYAFSTAYPVTCTTTTATLVAATVQAAILAAAAGDTVCIPAGSATWPNGIVGINNKNMVLAGAAAWGGGTTTISGSMGMSGPTGSRVTGITWIFNSSQYMPILYTQGFRIDHNNFTGAAWPATGFLVEGNNSYMVEGLIDNNTLNNMRVLIHGNRDNGLANNVWAAAENMGTEHAVYLEDNIENNTNPTALGNGIDGSWGMRVVARFNTLNSERYEFHGVQAENFRGGRLYEFYGNALNASLGVNYRPFLLRGGTGAVFHNTYDGGFTTDTIDIDGPRQIGTGTYATWGYCDGASQIDGNTATFEGWPCRDQIGRSTDASLWNGVLPAPAQLSTPVRIWGNTRTDLSQEMVVLVQQAGIEPFNTRMATKQILVDRDFYILSTATASTQTTGIREGTLATMAGVTTCTQGVGFWATNAGTWNTSASNPQGVNAAGADGALYVCGASNNWVLTYTPYTYPHPLQGAANPPAPDAVTTSYVAAFRGPTFAAIIWSRSTDANHKAYNIYRCATSGACTNLVKQITPASAAAAHSPETQWIDTSLYVAGQNCYSVSDVNTLDYVGPATTPSCLTVTGKQ